MLKHAACAAAISSSGLVPFAFSKRVANVNGVLVRTPLAGASMVPLPCLRLPCQVPDALRWIAAMMFSFSYGRAPVVNIAYASPVLRSDRRPCGVRMEAINSGPAEQRASRTSRDSAVSYTHLRAHE